MTDPVVAPKTAPKSITTKHLAYELAEQHQLTKHQGLEMMEELVGMITKHLKKGERVKIAGLGILQVRHRAARMGRANQSQVTTEEGRLLQSTLMASVDRLVSLCPLMAHSGHLFCTADRFQG
jgi:DNA-binding protein HU-beta